MASRPLRGITTSWGETIIGLTLRADGRYVPVGRGNVAFGKDEARAVARFRAWKAASEGKNPHVEATGPAAIAVANRVARDRDSYPTAPDMLVLANAAAQEIYKAVTAERDRIRRLILTDPKGAAGELDIPWLAWADTLKAPAPSMLLSEVADLYLTKNRPGAETWARKTRRYWDEFCKCMGDEVRTVRDIQAAHIGKYYDYLTDRFNAKQVARSYLAHRFGQVKTFFRFALTRGIDQTEIQRVLNLCVMLKKPTKRDYRRVHGKPEAKSACPISKADFDKLLTVCDAKWRAVFMLALNCMLYPGEVASVRKSEIDLDKRTYVGLRPKTDIRRVAVLWQRTVDAIRAYQASPKGAKAAHSEYLFICATGKPYTHVDMAKNFWRRRALAGMEKSVEFAHIRDGGYTAAITGGASSDLAKLIAGHAVGGMSDSYIARNPTMVAPACEAIERFYFPPVETPEGKPEVSNGD